MKCEKCGKIVKDLKGLSVHLSKTHKFSKLDLKIYYDNNLKVKNNGKCIFCGDDAIFKGLTKGYHNICDSKECLGKTRATGTYKFLMYKYNLSENDAILLMNSRAKDRGDKIKTGLQKSFENNEDFFKEKSRQSIKFWLKRGYTQNDAQIEVKKATDDIHTKTWKKRKDNPELYKDVNPTQIGYWLKKGYTEDESKEKISKRQITFSLQICKEKYGEIKGKEIWLDRQYKWLNNYKKSNFSKISQELYWEIYKNIKGDNDIFFATLKNGSKDDSGKNNEYKLILDNCIILPDFFIKNKNKIIEFDGTYYHRNTPENIKRTKERDDAILRNGYIVLHIKEKDYKENKNKVIQQCIDFINK